MNTNTEVFTAERKTLWHIVVDLAYEGKENDSGRDGVNLVLSALCPLIESGKGIKRVRIMRVPDEK